MAQDYQVKSITTYDTTTGDVVTAQNVITNYGSDETDDGFWNVGDELLNTNPFKFQGHYVNDDELFLVFVSTTPAMAVVMSPGATVPHAGYPTNFNDDLPILTTTQLAVCFGAGTMIMTPDGEQAVETLSIGDHVVQADGDAVAVKWIGKQTMRKLFTGPRMQPVLIKSGALGNGLPHSDLTVTGDHGMVIDGLVVNASALVNGDSIDRVPLSDLPELVTYYHIETEAHDVILANGTPAETFIDTAGRKGFDNYQEYLDLYGVERIIPEMARPRIATQRLLPQKIKTQLGIDAVKASCGDLRAC